jgi:hypothetical protein
MLEASTVTRRTSQASWRTVIAWGIAQQVVEQPELLTSRQCLTHELLIVMVVPLGTRDGKQDLRCASCVFPEAADTRGRFFGQAMYLLIELGRLYLGQISQIHHGPMPAWQGTTTALMVDCTAYSDTIKSRTHGAA